MTATDPAGTLRVVTYNVRGLRDDGAAVARVLRDLDPDVAFVQELPKVVLWRGRAASFARRADLLYAAGGGTTGGTALFTAVRVDLREVQEHRLRRTPGLSRRGLVLARLEKDGVAFAAGSLHLGLDAGERARHLTDLTGLVNRLGLATTVLGGDLNEAPSALTWTRLASQYTDAGAADPTPTFPVADPRERIDGIFVRGADVTSYRVVDTPDACVASDHFPVVAELTLPR
ncbi:endonuclease/exonuclease/phosphatase family protein [Jiangella alkaliphila]|uniref:Metal-dependent hydrolase, endonuclease/exonuclease/phosphatase family n=1 Tax=Jiangella alkaliphila TaxID=419479 RepID=A0A1H2KAU4_9ACTN|nr:endonuclease/exonuclease/phosphatase family protein [Jiangella alkaliphila]SDU65814.1 Metal-dependent hydrolase, endonuclease/exonuclease/phosphatase family [Jiangella alkaliphila]